MSKKVTSYKCYLTEATVNGPSPWVIKLFHAQRGWSGGAMVLGKLPVPGRRTIRIIVGQGPTALVVGAGGGCLDIFQYHFSFLTPSLSGRRPDID